MWRRYTPRGWLREAARLRLACAGAGKDVVCEEEGASPHLREWESALDTQGEAAAAADEDGTTAEVVSRLQADALQGCHNRVTNPELQICRGVPGIVLRIAGELHEW